MDIRLAQQELPALPPASPGEDARVEAALRLSAAVRDLTLLIREASEEAGALRQGRRGAAERLAAVLARAEVAAQVQAVRTRELAESLGG